MTNQSNWKWTQGSWGGLVESGHLTALGPVPYKDIGSPWAMNIHCHPNYDRLFWSIREEGLKTPLLLRSWEYPFRANRTSKSCRQNGNRLDNTPSVVHNEEPKYELVIGNMRWCAAYICSYEVPCLLLPDSEQGWLVEDLWEKYHPIFEGNWYSDPDHGGPNKATKTHLVK